MISDESSTLDCGVRRVKSVRCFGTVIGLGVCTGPERFLPVDNKQSDLFDIASRLGIVPSVAALVAHRWRVARSDD